MRRYAGQAESSIKQGSQAVLGLLSEMEAKYQQIVADAPMELRGSPWFSEVNNTMADFLAQSMLARVSDCQYNQSVLYHQPSLNCLVPPAHCACAAEATCCQTDCFKSLSSASACVAVRLRV